MQSLRRDLENTSLPCDIGLEIVIFSLSAIAFFTTTQKLTTTIVSDEVYERRVSTNPCNEFELSLKENIAIKP